jgi:hypothetical protein
MSAGELDNWAMALLVKIHVITGWVIPEDEGHMNILVDQFRKKLTESYANVNTDETEYAFRVYGTTVKDWGKSMNLSLIDEVMIPYLEQRAEVSKVEEQKALPPAQEKEDISDQTMREWYEDTAKQVKENKLPLELIPIMLADWLIEKGELSNVESYHTHAARWIGNKLFANATDRDTRRQYNDFKGMYNSGEFSGHWIEKIAALSKRMAVNDKILKEPK